MKKENKEKIKIVLIVLFIGILILLFLEFFLQTFFPQKLYYFETQTSGKYDPKLSGKYDHELGIKLISNSNTRIITDEFDMNIEINSEGFRGDEFNFKKNKSIIFLGDSLVFGYGVNFNQTFVHHFSEKLNEKYNFFGLGINGYGTGQELIVLKNHIEKIKPEKVVLVMNLNDFVNVVGEYTGAQRPLFFLENEPYFFLYEEYQNPNNFEKVKLDWIENPNLFLAKPITLKPQLFGREEQNSPLFKIKRFLLTKSHTTVFFWLLLKKSSIGELMKGENLVLSDYELSYYNRTLSEDRDYTIKLTSALIDEINNLSRKNNAELFITFIPSGKSFNLDDGDFPNEIIKEYSLRNNIKFIDLFPVLNESFFYKFDSHLNQQGHKIVFEEIGKILK